MLISGGYITEGPTWPTYNDCYLLDLETHVWEKTHNMEEKMGNHVMVVDNNTIYIVGGIDFDSSLTAQIYTSNFMESLFRKKLELTQIKYF